MLTTIFGFVLIFDLYPCPPATDHPDSPSPAHRPPSPSSPHPAHRPLLCGPNAPGLGRRSINHTQNESTEHVPENTTNRRPDRRSKSLDQTIRTVRSKTAAVYIDPQWEALAETAATGVPVFGILNPASGPGEVTDETYPDVIDYVLHAGAKVSCTPIVSCRKMSSCSFEDFG